MAVNSGDVDAGLLEHAAVQHSHFAAAASGAVPWRNFKLAGIHVRIRALNLGFYGLKFSADPIAQVAEPRLSCGLLVVYVIRKCHGGTEMNRHWSPVNPSVCLFASPRISVAASATLIERKPSRMGILT